jgi:hypothetical protein
MAMNLKAVAAAIKSANTPAPLKKGLIKKYGKKLGLTKKDINKYMKLTKAAKKVSKKVKAKKKNPKDAKSIISMIDTQMKSIEAQLLSLEKTWEKRPPKERKIFLDNIYTSMARYTGLRDTLTADEINKHMDSSRMRKISRRYYHLVGLQPRSNPPWDGKTPWKMTQAEWNKIHKDYKGITDGKKRALALDPNTGGTTSVPVEIVKSKKVSKKFKPGDKVSYSGYPGTIMRHYSGNTYEVRLASGDVAVDASELKRITRKQWLETPSREKVKSNPKKAQTTQATWDIGKKRYKARKGYLPYELTLNQYLAKQKGTKYKDPMGRETIWSGLDHEKRVETYYWRAWVDQAQDFGEKIKSSVLKSYEKSLTGNPPVSSGTEIYERITAIEATKGNDSLWPEEDFRHDFKQGGKILGLPNGDLLIKRGRDNKPLWKNIDYDESDGTRKNPARSTRKRKPSFGSQDKMNYAVQVDGLDSNEFYKAPWGRQLSDLKKIEEFKKTAKVGYAGAKHKTSIKAVREWIKLYEPTEFYAKWKKDSPYYKDDSVKIWYKGSPHTSNPRKPSKASKYYVGLKNKKAVKIHALKNPPTQKSHGHHYTQMVGPMTKKAAQEYVRAH